MADSTKIVNVIVFAVAVLLWVGFALLLLNRQGNLSDIWAGFRGQSWLLQVLEALILLPWVAGLWVWNTSWDLWIRTLMLIGLFWVSLYLLLPWRSN
jgi:hypothetical protein